MDRNLLKGTLDLLILEAVAAAPKSTSYGYAISQDVLAGSGDEITLSEGSLYPALHRMEQAGWLTAEWGEAGGRRRKYYRLTAAGRKALQTKRNGWAKFAKAIGGVVKPAGSRLGGASS